MKTQFRNLLSIVTAIGLILYLGGCSASEEAEQEEGTKQEFPAEKQPEAKTTMKKDTAEVKVVPPAISEPSKEIKTEGAGVMAYAVQVGAFESPDNAARAEQTLKSRFTYPVLRFYDEVTKLYKVSIGNFATKDQALDFRKTLNEKYPGEYRDAWIVEVTK